MGMLAGWLKKVVSWAPHLHLRQRAGKAKNGFPREAYVLPPDLDIETEEGLCEVPEWCRNAFLPDALEVEEEVDAFVVPEMELDDDVAGLPKADEDALFLEDLLLSHGHKNSGINLDAHVTGMIARLSPAERRRLVRESARLDEMEAVNGLIEALLRAGLPQRRQALLRRLRAVLRFSREDFPLPPAATPRPDDGNRTIADGPVFYMVHMSAPYVGNGYVTRTETILKVLRAMGADAQGMTRLGFPQEFARFRKEPVQLLRQEKGLTWHMLPDRKRGRLNRPLDDYVQAYAERVIELAEQYQPVLLHAASNYLNGLAAISAARRLGLPCIYEVRGLWEITSVSHDRHQARTINYHLSRRLENQAARNADAVITISQPLKEFLAGQGVEEERIFVVPNGVDTQTFMPRPRDHALARRLGVPDDAVVIGYVGSIVRYEGLDLLLEAVARLDGKARRKVRLLIVGDGVALPGLRTLAEELGIAGQCIFTGRLPFEEVPAHYSLVDVAPFPRRSLPVTELVPPLKPFEAMAMEKAVIVSSVAALKTNVVPGRTAIMFEKDDADDLAACLQRLIGDEGLRRSLAAQALEWVREERSIAALARHMAAAYDYLGLLPDSQRGELEA